MSESSMIIENLDFYVDDLDYFKPQFYHIASKILERTMGISKEISLKLAKALLKSKSEELYEIFKEKMETNQELTNKLFSLLKSEVIIERPIESNQPNVDKFNTRSNEAFHLDQMEKMITQNFNKRLVGMMTTVTYPPTYSFHDSWYIVNFHRELALSIIKEYSFLSISTVEYMHSGNKNYKMKGKKQIEWYVKLLTEVDVGKQLSMLEATGTKTNDFGIMSLTGAKLPYLYYPGGPIGSANLVNLIKFYKICRQRFGYIKDLPKRRLISKDPFIKHYGDQPDTYTMVYNPTIGRESQIQAYSPYFCSEIQKVSRIQLLESLFNYFNVILFNRRHVGDNGEMFDPSMVNFCQEHYRYIRDTLNDLDKSKLNKVLDKYFPVITINEIGEAFGVFEIDKQKLKLKVSNEEYKEFLKVNNYYSLSKDFYIEFTFFSFLAYQHLQNGLSNVGYPHIHIHFLVEAIDHVRLNRISQDINRRISEATGLLIKEAVVTIVKEEETFMKGMGYITKNATSSFVDRMLTQLDENGNSIRDSKDPILYVDYYNQELFDLTEFAWYRMLGHDPATADGSTTNFTYAKDYLPLKLRLSKRDDEIFGLIVREFFPDKIPQLDKFEDLRSIDNKIFNIKFSPTNYNKKKTIWINYLQHYMVDRKLVICDGYIYQKRKEGKYSFELYFPRNSDGDFAFPKGWIASIKCFIESFSTSISPEPPSEELRKDLMKILENTSPGYKENCHQFPCIKINFRLVEYKDFVLDIINRCTYSEPPRNQYCHLYIGDIDRENIIPKIDELLSTSEATFEDFKNGRTKRTILGLLKHLNIYNLHHLSLLHETINVRFKKDSLTLFVGDSSSYKSKMLLLLKIIFPHHKVGASGKLDSFDIGHNIEGKCAIYSEESNKSLEKISKNERGPLLQLADGEELTGEKKFKDPERFSTANMSVSFCANIDENIGYCVKVPELKNRLNIGIQRKNPDNPGIFTEAEIVSVLGELLYFICMVSLSRDYFSYDRIPILHHYEEAPEPLERMHKYFLYGCNPLYLVKEGEPNRSALDIRDFIFNQIITHQFLQTQYTLPDKPTKTRDEMINEIISESHDKRVEKITSEKKLKGKIDRDVSKLLDNGERVSALGYVF